MGDFTTGQKAKIICPPSVLYLSALQLDADRYPRLGQKWTDKNFICPRHFSLTTSHFALDTDRWTDRSISNENFGGNKGYASQKTLNNRVSRLDSKVSVHLSTRQVRHA